MDGKMSRCSLYRSLTIITNSGGSEIIPEQTPTVPAKMPLAGTLSLPQEFEPKVVRTGCGRGGHPAQAEEAGPLSQRRRIARHDAGRACSGGRTHRGACYILGF